MAACAGSGVVNTRTCAQELHKIIACAAGKYTITVAYRPTITITYHFDRGYTNIYFTYLLYHTGELVD